MSNLIKLKQIQDGIALDTAVKANTAKLKTLEETTLPGLIAASKSEVYRITSDSTDIDALVADADITPKAGDVLIVTSSNAKDKNGNEIAGTATTSAYQYDTDENGENGEWIACDGNVDASKVILNQNITLAGEYDRVGTLTKSKNGTATFETSGLSVQAALVKMLSQTLQPKIKSNPSVTTTLTGAGALEVGTVFNVNYSASFSDGAYTYEDTTGATVSSWSVTDSDKIEAVSAYSGTFGGKSFTVTEDTNYYVTATATHTAGNVAKDNVGGTSSPAIQIAGGDKSDDSDHVTGYRAWFYGWKNGDSKLPIATLDSDDIRDNLTSSNGSFATSFSTDKMQQMIFAAPKGKVSYTLKDDGVTVATGITVSNATNGAPQTIKYKSVDVEGANNYTATAYDVFYVDNASADGGANTYNIVVG